MATSYAQTPIQNLPRETLIEIFSWCFGQEIPPKRFALVSKEWRSTMQSTPTFWRKMVALYVSASDAYERASQMSRRLELSQQVLLDVTIDTTDQYLSMLQSNILFDIASQVDVCRWRSLALLATPGTQSGFVVVQPKGIFSSLRSLHIEKCSETSNSWSLLLSAPSTLSQLRLEGSLPNCLQIPSFLHNIQQAMLSSTEYNKIIKMARLTQVEMDGLKGLEMANLPLLPATVKLLQTRGAHLSMLNLTAIQNLEIQDIFVEGDDKSNVHLPSLTSLVIPGGFRFCQRIIAPSLISLHLQPHLHNSYSANEWGKENSRVLKLFDEDAQPLSFTPTEFRIDFPISSPAILSILSHWTQIQHLNLDLLSNKRFAWKGPFSRALLLAGDPLCPNLVTFKLQTKWTRSEAGKWGKTVKRMFGRQERASLRTVSWTHGTAGDVLSILRREDVFPNPLYT